MSNEFRSNLVIKLKGASHKKTMQIIVNGFPKGVLVNLDSIKYALSRRSPDKELSNARIEEDEFIFKSGLDNNYTDGKKLIIDVKNKNFNSKSYHKGIVRPGHADYPAYIKYGDKYDYRGGGEFSGRLSVLYVILGELAKSALNQYGVKIASHLYQIGSVLDNPVDYKNLDINKLYTNQEKLALMKEEIGIAKSNGDSIGGIVEAIAARVKIGLGENYFGGLESKISYLMFTIPGAKSVSFGKDLDLAIDKGSNYNDQMKYVDNKVEFLSNNAGGINGGLANGENIVVRVAFRPTASISKTQKSIDIINKENIDLNIKGNHDACFAYRCGVIVESMLAIALLDSYLEEGK